MEKLCFLGDLFFDYEIIPKDIEKLSQFFKKNNYKVILNLEAPLVKANYKTKKRGPNLFQSSITIDLLKKINVIGVCLANNHIMDYGESALKETIEILENNNIKYCGAGLNIEKALEPMIIEISGKKVAVINSGWNIEETVYAKKNKAGAAPKRISTINKQLQKVNKQNIENVIVSLHWGFEYNLYPMPLDIDIAHKIIDKYNNVDMIIGHHPHTIQAYELYKNKKIYYSLGNFYFGSRRAGFKEKKFSNRIQNMCDFGLGIVYDIDSRSAIEEILFEYNYDEKETVITQKTLNEFVEDISNINYNNKEYKHKVKKYCENITPILTKNNIENLFKLSILYMKYFKPKIGNAFPFLKRIKRRLKNDKIK